MDILQSKRSTAGGPAFGRPFDSPVLSGIEKLTSARSESNSSTPGNKTVALRRSTDMEQILPAHLRKAKALIAAVKELHSERADVSSSFERDINDARLALPLVSSGKLASLSARSIDDTASATSYEKELSPRKLPGTIFPPKEIIASQSSLRFSDSPDVEGTFVERVLRVSKRSASQEASLRSQSGFDAKPRQPQANSSTPKASNVQSSSKQPLSSVRIDGVAAPTGSSHIVYYHSTNRTINDELKINQKMMNDEELNDSNDSQTLFPPRSLHGDKSMPSTDIGNVTRLPSIPKKDRYIL